MSIEETEAASAAVVKIPANRVSLADIEANIMFERIETADALMGGWGLFTGYVTTDNISAMNALSTLTICIMVLRNGFTVIGKAAPADPENYDRALGRKFAREDAIRQIWPLMGYAKKQELIQA